MNVIWRVNLNDFKSCGKSVEIRRRFQRLQRRDALSLDGTILLSNFERRNIDPPSPNWPRLQSSKNRMRESGLWNTNHVEKFHGPAFLERRRACGLGGEDDSPPAGD